MSISILDYDNFGMYSACLETSAKYNLKRLKLRSSFYVAEVKTELVKPMIVALIKSRVSFGPIGDIKNLNMEIGSTRISETFVSDIPECLSNSLLDISNVTSLGDDIMSPLQETMSDVINSVTDTASKVTSLLGSYMDSYNNSVNKVNDTIHLLNNTVGAFISAEERVVYELLDQLSSFLTDTSILEDYIELKDLKKCIESNCNTKVKDLGFLYSDEEQKEFILPIDINTGRIRIHKFFNNPSANVKESANKLERGYYKYLNEKIRIAKEQEDLLRIKGISDIQNPFKAAGDRINSTKSALNNLF